MELRGAGSLLLAIDTCGASGGVALGFVMDPEPRHTEIAESDSATQTGHPRNLGVLYRELPGRTFAERLLVSISDLLEEAGVGLHALSGIVVVAGPGSFTGIRIGISAVKGLAEGLGLPVIAVSRLELLVGKAAGGNAVAVLDAGRSEFFVGIYRAGLSVLEALATREELLNLVKDSSSSSEPRPLLLACEECVLTALADLHPKQMAAPTAIDAWILGAERLLAGRFEDVASLDANYLRRSETEMLARIASHLATKASGRHSSRG